MKFLFGEYVWFLFNQLQLIYCKYLRISENGSEGSLSCILVGAIVW